jgi:hypothetical protein
MSYCRAKFHIGTSFTHYSHQLKTKYKFSMADTFYKKKTSYKVVNFSKIYYRKTFQNPSASVASTSAVRKIAIMVLLAITKNLGRNLIAWCSYHVSWKSVKPIKRVEGKQKDSHRLMLRHEGATFYYHRSPDFANAFDHQFRMFCLTALNLLRTGCWGAKKDEAAGCSKRLHNEEFRNLNGSPNIKLSLCLTKNYDMKTYTLIN